MFPILELQKPGSLLRDSHVTVPLSGTTRCRQDILSNPQRGYWNRYIPPRISRIPKRTCIVVFSRRGPMSRSATPSVCEDGCSERMVFAERSPDEPAYGSAATANLLPSVPRGGSEPLYSALPRLATRPPSSSYNSRPRPRTLHCTDDDLAPYSLMGAAPGLAFRLMAHPEAERLKGKSPKPRSQRKATTSTSSSGRGEHALCRSLQRIKRFATRQSISSLDIFAPAPPDSPRQETAASIHTVSSTGTCSLESAVSGRSDGPDENAADDDNIVVAHRLVGDVWERQGVDQVIPALRSLRSSSKRSL